ncbi:APC family permease [Mycoplasma sp. 'Moose RK']|uniref:APC family permease n=1 Tax=Mycoplasma sp. 'Moose RK' TaxID=2780095 RepID=UPI0018C2477A|nr:amino acid permease [Mycoplasma sp. 'Moose RK']MBG0730696.1 amino acid permease [Mycoplasma sp. 'Moose RK']
MTIKKSRKLGFFAALSMMVGSVVGIGIFFKNATVGSITNHNGYAWLFAWVIGGLISLFAAINFSEISFLKQTRLNGLANWAYQVGGKKAGYATLFNYTFYYLGLLSLILSVFVSEIMIWFIEIASGTKLNLPFYVHLIIGLVFLVFFTGLNFYSIKASGYFALISTVLKFIPLVIALFAGIFFPKTFNDNGSNAFITISTPEKNNDFSFSGLILALPAVLFAYDSFLSVGSLHNKVDKAKKRVPFIITVGMILIAIVYTLIGLSSILHNKGTISDLIKDVFPKKAADYVNIFVSFFLLISAFGVLNAINAQFINQMKDVIKFNAIFGSFTLKKKMCKLKVTIIYTILTFLFWALIVFIPSLAVPLPLKDNSGFGFGSDVIIDSMSNFPSLIFFAVYMIIIIVYCKKRKEISDPNKQINKYFYWISTIFSIALILIVICAFVYSNLESVINKPFENSEAGVFASHSLILTNIGRLLIFIFQIAVFFSFPIINRFLIKKVDKIELYDNFEKSKIEQVEQTK